MSEEQWYSFDGDDGCEDCNGWNGVDRRCDCGNRRVSWECLKGKCECKTTEDYIKCDNSWGSAF